MAFKAVWNLPLASNLNARYAAMTANYFIFLNHIVPQWFVLAIPSARNGILYILLSLKHLRHFQQFFPVGNFVTHPSRTNHSLLCHHCAYFWSFLQNSWIFALASEIHKTMCTWAPSCCFLPEFLLPNSVSSWLVTAIDWLDEKMRVARSSAWWEMHQTL